MPHNAVVDASVLVSAFLFPDSVPGHVIRLADQGLYALHVSPILMGRSVSLAQKSTLKETLRAHR